MVPLFGAIPGGPELLIVFLLFGVFGLLLPIGVACWVYQDAAARGNGNATVWAIAIVIAGLFAWIVGAPAVALLYVLVGRE